MIFILDDFSKTNVMGDRELSDENKLKIVGEKITT